MADERILVDPPASLKSSVWRHFAFEKTSGVIDKTKVICRICSENLRYQTGTTTNMMQHLKRKHNIENESKNTKTSSKTTVLCKPTTSGQVGIADIFKKMTMYNRSSDRHSVITKSIGVFLAKDMRPYSLIENVGFIHMVNTLDPRYEIPSRTHFSEKVIPSLYKETKEMVEHKIKAAPFVALTSDSWTSRATQSYNTVTAHVIDSEWNINNYVLETTIMTESHTSENISQFLTDSISRWNLKRAGRNPSLTTDNAANVVNAAKLANLTHVRCFAHTVNLASQRGLRVSQMDRLLGRVRRIVSFFHRSTSAAAVLISMKVLLSLPSHKLINDVPTRWNSSYDMLERYLEQQPAIEAALFTKDIKKNAKDIHLLSEDDVTSAENVVKVLGPLKTITTVMSDSKSPTLSMIHPLKEQMILSLQARENDSTLVVNVKTVIRENLESRYTDPDVLQFLYESSSLDPRFKSMPYLSVEERSNVISTLTAKAVQINQHYSPSLPKVKVENQAETSLGTLPALPDLAETTTTDASVNDSDSVTVKEEPPMKKMKCALDDIFGDVFVTKIEPGHSIETKVDNEILSYKAKSNMPLNSNPLEWWKVHEHTYPLLSNLAKKYLCIPATSVASERVFSTAGDVVTAQRSCLAPDQVDCLIFLKKNFNL